MSPDRDNNRLEEIAKWLDNGAIHVTEDVKYGFMMAYWKEDSLDMETVQEEYENVLNWMPGDCGGAMCIGGAAEEFFGTDEECLKHESGTSFGAKLLSLTYEDANKLFFPWEEFTIDDFQITPEKAAQVVRHLIKTGEVDWSILEGVETGPLYR